ncbi:MAG: winged helix-turn-helix transcriptional regulator [Halobacteriota archaeon]
MSQKYIRLDSIDEKIVAYLSKHKFATAAELQRAIGPISRTTVFYRLLTLRAAGIVTSHRTSRKVVVYVLSEIYR